MNTLARSSLAAASLIFFAATITPSFAQWYQGPSGGPAGQPIDDWVANKKKTNIRGVHIYVSNTDNSIRCVRTYYPSTSAPSDPTQSESAAVGTPGCVPSQAIRILQFRLAPDEYIIGIGGNYTNRIRSLRFYTNKNNSPVYGDGPVGKIFGYTAPSGQMIVAFIGAGDSYLRSIGVMYAPCTPATKACK